MPEVSPDVSLARWTTLGLGGPARRMIVANSVDEIVQSVRSAGDGPVLILAGGSNVVIGDDGFPGLVVLIRSDGWSITADDGKTVELVVQAGQNWDGFVAYTVAEGLAGVECLSGVPGSTGATPIQNVGAYGQDVSEVITAVTVLDRLADEVVELSAAECEFAYRGSKFKHNDRWVVLSVAMRLVRSSVSTPIRYAELARRLGVEPGDHVSLEQAREAVLALRSGKGMVLDPEDPDTRSVGSFFMNPVLSASAYQMFVERVDGSQPSTWPEADGKVKVSAAWLIEHAGFHKGYARGGAAISGKHTLALTNRGGRTEDLLELAREVRDGVHERFGVTLRPEPVLINCEM
ncbi:MAG: UDP-N-acetylmuramate dehydrogenase [Hamadaea sp.]|uniref:UDP-N-acetylmuramate dehydrogenase n=1 Tax=Hamadaea sp. TaxID=2024425 RepID=UPI0017A5CB60|nr:UDP-N-acetylmuramate dehydrogenase [Hamadaea sp.]NUR70590.1 UDP-N-acetylmuramate dehydrogenase [Hamadaea sp.]NUT19281.1 UDP-N-acetylmuramate dehydrogenase [Hamadaea sp.]